MTTHEPLTAHDLHTARVSWLAGVPSATGRELHHPDERTGPAGPVDGAPTQVSVAGATSDLVDAANRGSTATSDQTGGSPPDAGARWGGQVLTFGRAHLAVVLVAVVVAAGIAISYLTGSRAESLPMTVTTPGTQPSSQVTPSTVAQSSASASPVLVVHVIGAVRHPGVVRLRASARVIDAIAAAGGLRPSADPGQLNLAEPLCDGCQVVIGTRTKPGGELRNPAGSSSATGGAAGAGASNTVIDLNTATRESLDSLPGVGPVMAQRIIDWRTAHNGRFTSVAELQEIDGIGAKTYAKLAPYVRV